MSASPNAADAETEHGLAADLLSKITQISSHAQPRVIAHTLASLDQQERRELDRLLAKLILGLSAG